MTYQPDIGTPIPKYILSGTSVNCFFSNGTDQLDRPTANQLDEKSDTETAILVGYENASKPLGCSLTYMTGS